MIREYAALSRLRSGEVLVLDGLSLRMDEGELQPGDLYVAERNGGPVLLTVKSVNYDGGWVVPTTFQYSYDIYECVKVKEA